VSVLEGASVELDGMLHFQGSEPMRPGTELAGAFARLGVRVIQPTYNYRCARLDRNLGLMSAARVAGQPKKPRHLA
jgi:hypothetical protein